MTIEFNNPKRRVGFWLSAISERQIFPGQPRSRIRRISDSNEDSTRRLSAASFPVSRLPNQASFERGQALLVVIGMMLLLGLTLAAYFKILVRDLSVTGASRRSVREIAEAKNKNVEAYAAFKQTALGKQQPPAQFASIEMVSDAFPGVLRFRGQADPTLPALLLSSRTNEGLSFRSPNWRQLRDKSLSLKCDRKAEYDVSATSAARATSIYSCKGTRIDLSSSNIIAGNLERGTVVIPAQASVRSDQPTTLTILGDADIRLLDFADGGGAFEILATGQLTIERVQSSLRTPTVVLFYSATGDIRVNEVKFDKLFETTSALCAPSGSAASTPPLALSLLASKTAEFLGLKSSSGGRLGCDYPFASSHWTNYEALGDELWPRP